MKIKKVALLIFICPVMVYGQKEFRPIIDSSVTCSYYKNTHEFSESPVNSKQILEVFYIVEKMPVPYTKLKELEAPLGKAVKLNEYEKTLNGEFFIQCVINCKGTAGDFQIAQCPKDFINIGCQALNFLRQNLVNWNPGLQSERNVDVLIGITVNVNSGKFELTL